MSFTVKDTNISDATDIVDRIAEYNKGRDPERLALKYRAIADNPFSFLRGTCHLFYAELPDHELLRDAPAAWICGDLHLENLGTYKADNRLVYFDLNDFDEAVLAPCTWETVRLLTSILIAAKTLKIDTASAQAMCTGTLDAYAHDLVRGKAHWIDRDGATGLIGDLFRSLKGRKRQDFIESRTVLKAKNRVICTDKGKALAASEFDQERVRTWLETFRAQQEHPEFYRPLDIARRIAGTGSLGVERFAMLVEGKGGVGGHYLLDLKACIPSSLAPYTPCKQPKWSSEAERVATVGARVQAVAPAFLEAVDVDGKPFVLKELQPSSDSVDLEHAATHLPHMGQLLFQFGRLAAWAQLRSSGRQGSATADALIEFGQNTKKLAKLIEVAQQMAERVEHDWQEFAAKADKLIVALPKAG